MEFVALSTILARGEKSISPRALYELQQPLVEALIEWRDNGSAGKRLTEQSIEISNDGKHIKILDASGDEAQNITDYGGILLNATVVAPQPFAEGFIGSLQVNTRYGKQPR